MTYRNLLYEKESHVVTITINRPEVHNCINHATNLELQDAWKSFRDDEDAFVAIFTGAGDKAFSSGWDLQDAAVMAVIQRDGDLIPVLDAGADDAVVARVDPAVFAARIRALLRRTNPATRAGMLTTSTRS